MQFNDLGQMHNLALGRSRGEYKKDGQQGCHGKGGILDNRVITLEDSTLDERLGSASVSASHKDQTRALRFLLILECILKVRIGLDGNEYRLGTFTSEIKAANAYAWVQASEGTLRKR